MPIETTNIKFIRSFIRNAENLGGTSEEAAQSLSREIESIVLSRLSSGKFLGGEWDEKPYSTNPIKAYKLGTAVVSGKGMSKQLSINGMIIDENDWYWGSWDRKQKGVNLSASRPAGNFGDFTPKPVPVFIPGYREWRVRYNGLSPNVNLEFTGRMLDNFYVDVKRARGSNQFGGSYEMNLEVEQPFSSIGAMTDYYRNWLSITEEELTEAIRESGADLASIFFRGDLK